VDPAGLSPRVWPGGHYHSRNPRPALVIDFADRVAAEGMTVFLPSLFGTTASRF